MILYLSVPDQPQLIVVNKVLVHDVSVSSSLSPDKRQMQGKVEWKDGDYSENKSQRCAMLPASQTTSFVF